MRTSITILFIFFSITFYGQEDAWVYFKDKPQAKSELNTPLNLVSERALLRRAQQNIQLDETDAPIETNYYNQIKNSAGIQIMAKSKWLNALHIRGSQTDINNLKALSFVNTIQFANRSLNRKKTSNKIEKKINSHKSVNKVATAFNYGTSSNQIQMLNGHLLHENNYTGSGKIIALLDAGYPNVNALVPFKRMRENNLILGGYDFVSRNQNFYSKGTHGTMVLSTIAGYKENELIGTAPDASFYLFITEDVSSENPVEESYWVEAAEKADSLGVDIISSSLGYFKYENDAYSYQYSDMDGKTAFISRGADIAFSKGMVVVVSAGNSGNSTDPHIATPSDAQNVLTIGAVAADRNYASFSSIGTSFDGRVKPDVMAQGQSAVVCGADGTITTASGTSFSCPITAGLIACLWQANPNATNQEIVTIIKQSSDRFDNPDVFYGYGIPDFKKALDASLSIPKVEAQNFKLFPNPAQNSLTIVTSIQDKVQEIVFYNELGQIILNHHFTSNVATISVENFASGSYPFVIKSDVSVFKGTFIKQ